MRSNYLFIYIFTFLFIFNLCYGSYLDALEASKCAEYKQELSNITSATSYCFVISSQPLRICTNCYSEFRIFTEKYDKLLKNKIYNGHVSCSDILLQSDISTTLEDVYNVFLSVWKQGNCDQCYNKTGTFSEDYLEFIKLENSVMECLQNYTNASLHFTNPGFETIWEDYYFDNHACNKCNDKYHKVKEFYHDMKKKIKKDKSQLWEGICGDLGDMLNTTQYLWSKYYQCDIYSSDIALISPISAVIGITLIFYCLASTYFHDKMKMVLYKQRRLRHFSKDVGPTSLLETIR